MSSEKFCLRWNDFESNIGEAFKELRDDKDFFDVTLACDDEQLQAHKVILSACSPLFRNILRRNPHQHPMLYLKGVKITSLQSILDFMYHGEVNVAQEELNSFLSVAEELRVKGLTQSNPMTQNNINKETSPNPQPLPPSKPNMFPPVKERPIPPLPSPPPQPLTAERNPSMVVVDQSPSTYPVKSEPPPDHHHFPSTALQTEDYYDDQEDFSQYEGEQGQSAIYHFTPLAGNSLGHKQKLTECLAKVEENGLIIYKCLLCGKTSQRRDALSNHVENIHFPGSYQCHFCEQVFNSQNTRNVHIGRKHKFHGPPVPSLTMQ